MDEKFIFMKLGTRLGSQGIAYNGTETIRQYVVDQEERGFTWFSTNSLTNGMAKAKVYEFNDQIAKGGVVTLLFCVGKSGGGGNDFEFRANVLEVRSFNEATRLQSGECPEAWQKSVAKIWIKINNIERETRLFVRQFTVISSGKDLSSAINSGQFQFGYITKKFPD
jgi:hypothetical protein